MLLSPLRTTVVKIPAKEKQNGHSKCDASGVGDMGRGDGGPGMQRCGGAVMKNQEIAAEIAVYLYVGLRTPVLNKAQLLDLRQKAQELVAVLKNAESDESL